MKKTIVVAGAAGEGINTVESFIEKILKQHGYEIFSYKNYMSRVRGGYNYSTIVVSDEVVFATVESADIFIALNKEAYEHSSSQMSNDGLLIAPEAYLTESEMKKVITYNKEALLAHTKSKNAYSMAAVGSVLNMFGIERESLEKVRNTKWPEDVNIENVKAAEFGFDASSKLHTPPEKKESRMLIGGNQAVALGALAAGISFYCAYPMAPSTGVMTFLATYE
ncbi:MAG TPA: hypothetical protein DCS67_01510, partial [Clostridiales bacterium UBA8960]|nr:hypothetical protein [Clostridiales bacterium UBA8960]